MPYIEIQLGEMLQAMKDGTVTKDMLHRVNLGSIDGLRAAVINRSQKQLKTFLAMGDFRPLLFNSDDDFELADIRRIYLGHIGKVTHMKAVRLFVDRYQNNAEMMQLVGFDNINQLNTCISLLGEVSTLRLFRIKKIPFALGLKPSERNELLFLLSKNNCIKVINDAERLKKDISLGFGFLFQKAWRVSHDKLDTIIQVLFNPNIPNPFKAQIQELLQKKKNVKAIQLVDEITAIQQGHFDGIKFSYLLAYSKADPSLGEVVCHTFKAKSLQLLDDIKARFSKRVFSYFWNRKDFSGWPEDRALWDDYIDQLIDKGAYELIYTFDQFKRTLGQRSLEKQAFCQALEIDVQRFSTYVEQVDSLFQYYNTWELDKAVKGRQLHFYFDNLSKIMTVSKNQDLIAQLTEKRNTMCGIGTRRLKLFLNKLIKTEDVIAQCYRLALELQDTNIVAKRQYGGYRDKAYERKRDLLRELIGLCRTHGWTYGYQASSVIGVDAIIYFELPGMEQISFHTRLRELGGDIPPYPKPWNAKENYTLIAIEQAIMNRYGEAIANLK